ncbi:hypothetical protein EDD21DRAFT_203389 [Dissophora ornata]|nr:hypothetical protein EDD21DRAFT_203389 [Dissophora ornata]
MIPILRCTEVFVFRKVYHAWRRRFLGSSTIPTGSLAMSTSSLAMLTSSLAMSSSSNWSSPSSSIVGLQNEQCLPVKRLNNSERPSKALFVWHLQVVYPSIVHYIFFFFLLD